MVAEGVGLGVLVLVGVSTGVLVAVEVDVGSGVDVAENKPSIEHAERSNTNRTSKRRGRVSNLIPL
jgi:hypothetical protein